MTTSTGRHFSPVPLAKGSPTLAQWYDLRRRPPARPVGRQRWNQLLFAHWKIDPASLLVALPVDVTIFPLVPGQRSSP